MTVKLYEYGPMI